MKKHAHVFPVLTVAILYVLLFTSCGAVRILSTEADPVFRLSDYETFAFTEMTIDPSIDPVYVKRIDWIKQDIAEYLTDRGLKLSAGNSGLLINIGIVVEEKIQTRETSIREAPVYMGQRNYSWQSEEVELGRYHEGTATVDLIDRQKNVLMWQGVAQSIIEKKDANSKKNIAIGVQKLFAELP